MNSCILSFTYFGFGGVDFVGWVGGSGIWIDPLLHLDGAGAIIKLVYGVDSLSGDVLNLCDECQLFRRSFSLC